MPPQHDNDVFNSKSILNELKEHNDFFDALVDMIPAKLYVAGNTGDEMYNPKYKKGQFKESKESRRARSKAAKKNKFDPNMQESTRQEKIRKEKEDLQMSDDDDDESDSEMAAIQDDHEEEEGQEEKNDSNSNNDDVDDPKQSRIEALRAKLRAKLDEKRSQRPGGHGDSDAMVSKRAARRLEKQKRIELAKKRNANGNPNGGKTHTGKHSKPGKIVLVKDLGGSKINADTNDKTVGDDLHGIDFGGIAGLKSNKGNYSEANKSLKNMGKKSSLEKLLADAEKKKEMLRKLKESDDVDAKAKAKKLQWGETLKAASGEHTKETDPALLKKAIKRKAKKKAKSQEAWKVRTEHTKDKMDERQKIRNHNIKQRSVGGAAGANLSKKRIKEDENNKEQDAGENVTDQKKRPRLGPYGKGRAGFEGKKQDFINKGSEAGNSTKKNVKQ